jgi:hypothetical protein
MEKGTWLTTTITSTPVVRTRFKTKTHYGFAQSCTQNGKKIPLIGNNCELKCGNPMMRLQMTYVGKKVKAFGVYHTDPKTKKSLFTVLNLFI